MAPNLLGNLYPTEKAVGGASCFKDGKIWFGKTSLWMSADIGKTWTNVTPFYSNGNEIILSIDFLDSLNGLILTTDSIFLTNDGAMTWQGITPIPIFDNLLRAFFIGNARTIAVGYQKGLIISSNAGRSYTTTSLNSAPVIDGHWLNNGNASVIAEDNGSLRCTLYSTQDYGANWFSSGGTTDYDCWSFDFDKCDTNVIYLANDAAQTANDGKSHIFVSTDRGGSWNVSKSGTTDTKHFSSYFCGSVSSVATSTYAQTNMNGVLRTTDKGGSWQTIGGPNCGSDTRLVLAIVGDTVFAADSGGSIWATFNSGGEGNSTRPYTGSVLVSQNSLFNSDTLHCQSSITRSIAFIRTGCHNPSVINFTFIGSTPNSYTENNFTYDSLSITFTPKKFGSNPASLVITMDDGSTDTVSLNGVNDNIPFVYSFLPQNLFTGDTLTPCNPPLIEKFVITATGCPPTIVSQKVTAPDYTIVRGVSSPIMNTDTIIIAFQPIAPGLRSASYELVLSDGTTIIVPLNGIGKFIPTLFTAIPDTLFHTDSLYLCSDPDERKIIINARGCPLPKVVSEIIIGPSLTDYIIVHKTAAAIQGTDSILIDFKPTVIGNRTASCLITFDDGSTLTIPLQGSCAATQQLSFGQSIQATDTLGGSITMPIYINGLGNSEDIELVMHYSDELVYNGSFSPANITFDMPNEQWTGRSKLHIRQAMPHTILGYARFNLFNDSLEKSTISFDSLVVLSSSSPCQYILPQTVSTDTMYPPTGCGIDILSQYIHRGILPQLRIVPNPASGVASIVTTHDIGIVNVEVSDMLGIKQSTSSATLQKNNPAKIILPSLNGVYNIHVRSADRTFDLRAIVNR